MTRRRFYAPPSAFAAGQKIVRLEAEEARHLRDVLRLKTGDEVYVFDGEGKEFQCVVGESGRDFAQLRILAAVDPTRPESPLRLTLAISLLKGEKFDLVVQKATELGAARIVPVVTERADVHLRDEHDAVKRVARWQRIALEAAKQSGRARVPEVKTPTSFASLVAATWLENERLRLFFSERGGDSLARVVEGASPRPIEVLALVGSEGGLTDEETAQASQSGWKIVTLGGRTLRAETAAIAVVALLQHLFGDLK